jgi:hypothetical protein
MAKISIDGKEIIVRDKVLRAFLDASAWVIDSGDIFALLDDKYDRETLQAVRDLKGEIDSYLSSPVME